MQNNKTDFFFKALSEYISNADFVGEKMIAFCDLIIKSNKLYNLTSITQIDDMLKKHILDSFSINKLMKGKSVLDIGSGAGLPGIPLAIANPEQKYLLLDSNNKKIIFLNHVKINLDVKNVNLLHSRIEDFRSKDGFDTIVCRSYSSLSTIYLNSTKHLRKEGIIIAMKGKFPERELSELKAIDKNVDYDVKNLKVLGLKAERHAVIIFKK
jgi:16S rRNA (guanine527-N7)-methyltransferase